MRQNRSPFKRAQACGKGGKSKGKGKDKHRSQRMYHGESSDKACLCCGLKGHAKSNCRLKDEKCLVCGKLGHLKAVCRAGAAHQVEETSNTDERDEAKMEMLWALAVMKMTRKMTARTTNRTGLKPCSSRSLP